jgi:hypothetical protein
MTPPLKVDDAPPVTTSDEARERVADLVGRANLRQLWLMLLDENGRQLSRLIVIDGIPAHPQPGSAVAAATELNRILTDEAPGGSVILTLERPGTAALTVADQTWAHELHRSFGKVMPITGMFVAHDDGVCALPVFAEL